MELTLTDANFQEKVLNGKGVIVVDFWAPWCSPCLILTPILEELAEEYKGKFQLAKMNVDENPQTAAKYGIQGIPTVMIFRDGQLVDQLVGLQPRDIFQSKIDAALAAKKEA